MAATRESKITKESTIYDASLSTTDVKPWLRVGFCHRSNDLYQRLLCFHRDALKDQWGNVITDDHIKNVSSKLLSTTTGRHLLHILKLVRTKKNAFAALILNEGADPYIAHIDLEEILEKDSEEKKRLAGESKKQKGIAGESKKQKGIAEESEKKKLGVRTSAYRLDDKAPPIPIMPQLKTDALTLEMVVKDINKISAFVKEHNENGFQESEMDDFNLLVFPCTSSTISGSMTYFSPAPSMSSPIFKLNDSMSEEEFLSVKVSVIAKYKQAFQSVKDNCRYQQYSNEIQNYLDSDFTRLTTFKEFHLHMNLLLNLSSSNQALTKIICEYFNQDLSIFSISKLFATTFKFNSQLIDLENKFSAKSSSVMTPSKSL